MVWMALCRDRADIDTAPLRAEARERHFAYIESILDQILIAGPLGGADAAGWQASLFVYAVGERADAERLLQADPYYQAGIYAHTEWFRFTPAAGSWIGGTRWQQAGAVATGERAPDNSRLSGSGTVPETERLRRALDWLVAQPRLSLTVIEEAGQRFGLPPIEAATLYRWFSPHCENDEKQ
jgi:uncharacterized protein YciI